MIKAWKRITKEFYCIRSCTTTIIEVHVSAGMIWESIVSKYTLVAISIHVKPVILIIISIKSIILNYPFPWVVVTVKSIPRTTLD